MSAELSIQNSNDVIQKLVLDGDLSKMSPQQKVGYYKSFCESLGLNPLTQPFRLIKFHGEERLYATKDCTEQLRKIHGVSITDISTTSLNDVFIVTAKAEDKTGKTDCSTGAVNIKGLGGDNLANALMKAETKAKRRVTLSICGLGMLDESETDTIRDTVTHDIGVEIDDIPTKEERKTLVDLVYKTNLNEKEQEAAFEAINTCGSYEKYQQIQYRLESRLKTIDEIQNPSQEQISNHLRKVTS